MEEEYKTIDRENRIWLTKNKIPVGQYERLTPIDRRNLHRMVEGDNPSSNLQRRNLYLKLTSQEGREADIIDAISDEEIDEFFGSPLTPGEKLEYGRKF